MCQPLNRVLRKQHQTEKIWMVPSGGVSSTKRKNTEPEIASVTCDVQEKAGRVGELLRRTVAFQPRPRGWEQERREPREEVWVERTHRKCL